MSKHFKQKMNQKLTPMAQLIEFCEYRQSKATSGNQAAWNIILAKIKDDGLLKEEKQMVIDAFAKAYLIGEDEINSTDAEKAATAYFNQTFKQ